MIQVRIEYMVFSKNTLYLRNTLFMSTYYVILRHMCIFDSVCFEIGSQSELPSQTINNFFKQKIRQAHLL